MHTLSVIVTEAFEDLRKLWTLVREEMNIYKGTYKGFMDPLKPLHGQWASD